MKHIQLLCALALCLAPAVSCQKDRPQEDLGNETYTIMLYGCGGGSLDASTSIGLIEKLMMAGSSDKVKYCFEYKYSLDYQGDGKYAKGMKLTGTRRWTAPAPGEFGKKWTPHDPGEVIDENAAYIASMSSAIEEYTQELEGGNQFDLSDPGHIADYIDWCHEKCPADKYILLMKDHGGGWDFYEDSPKTKSQFTDDNIAGGKNWVALGDVVEGIRKSKAGRVDAIISDECLMASLEILTEYSLVADYALSAFEITVSLDGDDVNKAFKSPNLKIALSKLADLYATTNEPFGFYSDQGFYDLTKISELNAVVKKTGEFLLSKYESSPEWRTAQNMAVRGTCSASDVESRPINESIRQDLEKWLELSEEQQDGLLSKIAVLNNKPHYDYCFYDFLTCLIREAKAYENPQGKDFPSELKYIEGCLAEYDSALRSMSHISCTQKKDKDTPYRLCSPGIILQSLDPETYAPITRNNLDGYISAELIGREAALAAYKALEFDKQTSWSAFLESIVISGTPFFNPDRKDRQSGK